MAFFQAGSINYDYEHQSPQRHGEARTPSHGYNPAYRDATESYDNNTASRNMPSHTNGHSNTNDFTNSHASLARSRTIGITRHGSDVADHNDITIERPRRSRPRSDVTFDRTDMDPDTLDGLKAHPGLRFRRHLNLDFEALAEQIGWDRLQMLHDESDDDLDVFSGDNEVIQSKAASLDVRKKRQSDLIHEMNRSASKVSRQSMKQFSKVQYEESKTTMDQLKSATIEEHSGYEKWKIERAKRLKKVKMKMREISEYFTVFRGSFKTIEGSFGSSVLAYFRFVKWLLFLNLFTTLVILGCIVFPQEFMSPSTFNETIWTSNYSLANPWVEEAYHCSKNYTDRLSSAKSGTSQLIIDFFQGSGWMENTVLFTGYYFNKTYMFGDNTTHYNMPLAYLLTTAVYFGITLILMVQYTGKGVKDKMVNSGEKFYSNCNKVFCGWDYSLSTQKACTQKHKNIFMEFKNDLEELKRQQRRDNMSGCAKFRVFMIRVIVWTLVLAISGAAFYVIVLVVSAWQPELLKMDSVKNSSILQLIVEFLPSLTITALNALIPPIFYKLVIVEDYNPDNEIKISIARTVFLKLASVGVLVFTLHSQITSCADSESVCGNCPGVSAGCWESYVGQEFYKLVVLDFLVICLITFAVEFPRRIIVKRFQHKKLFQIVGLQEFEIPKNVLDIVYSQTICWFGGFFSPLIPAITVVKFFIFFYVKKLSLIQNCIPHKKPYKASRSSYFFMVVLLLSFGLCVLAIAIWVGRIPPSQTCGPFRVYTTDDFYMYTVVSNGVAQLHTIPRDIIYFLSNWLVYILVLIVVCLLIYYYHAVSNGNKKLVQLLKEQMALEGKDKQFLLARVNDALLRGDFTANNN